MGFQLHGKQIEHSQHVIQKMLPCIPTHRPKKRNSGWNECPRHRNGTTARPVSASENLHPITRRLKPARGLAVPHKRANPQQQPCPFVHTRSVAWPFWQVRTRVHMVFKTSYKTKLAVYWYANRTRYQKSFKTFFFELVLKCLQAQGEAPLCRNLENKSIGWKNSGMYMFV